MIVVNQPSSLRPGRAIMPRTPPRRRFSKRLCRPFGRDRPRRRGRPADRGMVCRRGPHRAEEQDHKALGAAGHPALSTARSAHLFGLHLRRHLSRTRQGRGLVLPRCNSAAMTLHLAEIAKTVMPGAHAVLILDQAGWHLSDQLVVPANITLLPLPPRCPELNPVENLWQYLRENWLFNRVFRSQGDILDHCCHAWNRLIAQPCTIMS